MRVASTDSPPHRPWPAPRRPWALWMRWSDLLFLHWPIPASALRPLVPAGLELDERDGSAWIGLVPFSMDIRPRFVPPLPGVSRFPEINLRTYVTCEGKPGVWFVSLDVPSRLAVAVARKAFHLPYHRARMSCLRRDGWVQYASERVGRTAPGPAFRGRYRPAGPRRTAPPGSLDAWLTERYCLYASDPRGGIHRGEVDHATWPLQPAEVEIERETFLPGLPVGRGEPPLAHFASALEVRAWTLRPSGTGRA